MSGLPPGEREATVRRIHAACEHPDAEALRALLPRAVALMDTGGDLPASTEPVTGIGVARRLLDLLTGADLVVQPVNGACAIVARRSGRVTAIVSFGFDGAEVDRVWITLSPLKLRRWN